MTRCWFLYQSFVLDANFKFMRENVKMVQHIKTMKKNNEKNYETWSKDIDFLSLSMIWIIKFL